MLGRGRTIVPHTRQIVNLAVDYVNTRGEHVRGAVEDRAGLLSFKGEKRRIARIRQRSGRSALENISYQLTLNNRSFRFLVLVFN